MDWVERVQPWEHAPANRRRPTHPAITTRRWGSRICYPYAFCNCLAQRACVGVRTMMRAGKFASRWRALEALLLKVEASANESDFDAPRARQNVKITIPRRAE